MTLQIYKKSAGLPKVERYGLLTQSRRASSSIGNNIAEGCGRSSDKEYAHFFQIAFGSATELQNQLILMKDLNYLNNSDFEELNSKLVEIKKMLAAMIARIRRK